MSHIMVIPSASINITASVNAAFTADKLNAAKSYVDITDCRHVHYKCEKTFHYQISREKFEPEPVFGPPELIFLSY